MSNKETDIAYVDRVIDGDTRAFSFLVKKYQDMVFTLALKIVGNREDAEDAAQEVFIKCYRSLRSFNKKSQFSTWLFRITYNHSVDVIKRKKHQKPPLDVNLSAALPDVVESKNDSDLDYKKVQSTLHDAIERLPGDDRMIVFLYYYDDQPLKEIADILGLKENNVKIRLHRIRQKLMTQLKSKKDIFSGIIS